MREMFACISAGAHRDPEAECAFVDSKIEMIRSHPTLFEADKTAAIAELEEKFKRERGRFSRDVRLGRLPVFWGIGIIVNLLLRKAGGHAALDFVSNVIIARA